MDIFQCIPSSTVAKPSLWKRNEIASALARAQTHLGVHHSPDGFHVQYELSKATSLALNRQEQKAKEDYEATTDRKQRTREARCTRSSSNRIRRQSCFFGVSLVSF